MSSNAASLHRPVISTVIDRPVDQLTPWTNNPRAHSDKQLSHLKANIGMYGFTIPLLIDEAGTVLSGHARLQAAREMQLKHVPVRVISGLSQAQKRAYVIADNKLAEMSSWNVDLLKSEMELLFTDDIDIEITGFSTAESDLILDPQASAVPKARGRQDEQDRQDLQGQYFERPIVSRLDDLWVLGSHRLLCANALEASSYSRLMGGEQAQMVISDPPYNVRINGHVCGNGKTQHKEFPMASGEMSEAQFTDFLANACTRIKACSQAGAVVYLFMDWRHLEQIQQAAGRVFGDLCQLCVWVKDNGGMGSFYRSQHELVLVYRNGNAPHINNFGLGKHRYRTNVWNYPGVNTFKGKGHELLALHPTVKPVALIADAMRDCSNRKGLILDPFAGSGTVLLAAERTGRYARAMELDPLYVDVAIARWERLTGRKAVLEATGQTFEEVRLARETQVSGEVCDGV